MVEGYGLTETCAPIAAGRINPYQIGMIGLLIPGSEGYIVEGWRASGSWCRRDWQLLQEPRRGRSGVH